MITGVDEIVYTILLIFLIIMSAFFSSSETAYMRANRFRIRRLAEKGNPDARRVEDILKEPGRLISAILLGNNFVNILASAIATALFISIFGERGILYATIAMTVVLLIFGDIIPVWVPGRHAPVGKMSTRLEGVRILPQQCRKVRVACFVPIACVFGDKGMGYGPARPARRGSTPDRPQDHDDA